jgi:hypothetical protein
MLGIQPLQVTCLSAGTFDRYYDLQLQRQLPLTERRPSRKNASDASVGELLRLSRADVGAHLYVRPTSPGQTRRSAPTASPLPLGEGRQ